ncbi:MAG: hypothetical protein PHH11_16305 [Methylomonas sp.]|nr:hypothetical protein [Methylomonas sp.]
MNATLLKYQMIALAILSVVMALEWGLGELNQSSLQDTLNKTLSTDYQSEPLSSLNLPKPAADSFINIVERPLFIEGRKPIPEAASEKVEQGADLGQLEDWALIGIYNKDKKAVALFRKQNEPKKFLKLNEQQVISGWQLKEIQADRVLLEQGGQQKTVMLRKPRPQSKAPPPKRPAPPVNPFAQPVNPTTPNVSPNNNIPLENKNDDS